VNAAKRILKTLKSADDLVASLLVLSEKEQICLLDSCGANHLGSRFLLAGINPVETFEISNDKYSETLRFLDDKLSSDNLFSFFSISYEFGLKLEQINPREKEVRDFNEPDVFLAIFDCLIIHDYITRETTLIGNETRFDELESKLDSSALFFEQCEHLPDKSIPVNSNFSKPEYLAAIEKIQEFIRRGDTYQTNLTQQICADLPENLTAQKIFWNLRKNNPAPFAAFLQRNDSTVVSASPERFFNVENAISETQNRLISASPIKGTRPRGKTFAEDLILQNELLQSEKDRAENIMIVDLLRNDLGRICEFGSVEVEKLCELETHPTLFHLVSTINGKLRANVKFSDIIRAVFPCGSITGAPKIRTMQLIDELETAPRGLSMGAIGYSIQDSGFRIQDIKTENYHLPFASYRYFDLSVAIRTMVIHDKTVVFNVGGGIVIDSIPETEYEETLLKAEALLKSFGGKL
jgi:para-aminobenzoate synthetase component 1